jgi:hypothetical protein
MLKAHSHSGNEPFILWYKLPTLGFSLIFIRKIKIDKHERPAYSLVNQQSIKETGVSPCQLSLVHLHMFIN